MGIEIDFLAVGDEGQSGDAIALRWGDLFGPRNQQWVVVVDGGFQSTGDTLVNFVRERYGTDFVDIVISTHPDADHINGLKVVLDKLGVGTLLMHQPWKHEHTNNISDLFKSGRVTDASVRARLRKSLDAAAELEAIARSKGVTIREPFSGMGTDDGVLTIVGPTKHYYQSLLPGFRGTPQPKDEIQSALGSLLGKAASAVATFVDESFNIETLGDDGETSPENNSSVITLINYDEKSYLLTGDAGQPALNNAADSVYASGHSFDSLQFVQVPHHGSRRNVGPSVLNRILGKPNGSDEKRVTAYVSAASKGMPKHPSRKVANAFRRRGAYVYATQGANIWHRSNAPERSDYSSITPLEFFSQVEE